MIEGKAEVLQVNKDSIQIACQLPTLKRTLETIHAVLTKKHFKSSDPDIIKPLHHHFKTGDTLTVRTQNPQHPDPKERVTTARTATLRPRLPQAIGIIQAGQIAPYHVFVRSSGFPGIGDSVKALFVDFQTQKDAQRAKTGAIAVFTPVPAPPVNGVLEIEVPENLTNVLPQSGLPPLENITRISKLWGSILYSENKQESETRSKEVIHDIHIEWSEDCCTGYLLIPHQIPFRVSIGETMHIAGNRGGIHLNSTVVNTNILPKQLNLQLENNPNQADNLKCERQS